MLHADVVIGLACRLRVGRQASPLKVAALLAAVCCIYIDRVTHLCKQDKQRDHDDFHDNPSLVLLLLISCSALTRYARSFIDRCMQSESELFGVVVRPKVHKEQSWLLVQHVAMNGRHLDAI